MTDTDQADLLTAIGSAVAAAPTAESAMQQAVRLLKDAMPHYTWVGIYVARRRRARARPVHRQAVAAHAHPARPRHLRRRRTEKATIVVDDVNADPRYLACSIETKSEIVVPIMRGAQVLGEIDIDSDRPGRVRRRRSRAARAGRGDARRPLRRRLAHGTHHHADSRRRHRPGSHAGGAPHLRGGGPADRLGSPRRRRHRLQAARPDAAGGSCSTRSSATRSR